MRRITPPRFLCLKNRDKKYDGFELSREKIKEIQHLETTKKAKQKELLDSKDNIFGAALTELDLAGLNLQNANLAKARENMRLKKWLIKKRKKIKINFILESFQEELASKTTTLSSPT